MDGSQKKLNADSATTAEELTKQLCDNIGLQDYYGFSLYIALYDKVSSLGSEGDHVMDAISQCEQYAKEQGVQERTAPWRVYFRKELFTPWHNPTEDPVATNLIYHQIVRGLKCGEYKCDKESDIAMIAAQQYFVEYGTTFDQMLLSSVLPNYIPDQFLKSGRDKALSSWEKLVEAAYKKSYYIREKTLDVKAKEDVVRFAKMKWPLLFSRFYEAIGVSGLELPKNNVIIAVNWCGLYLVNDEEQVLMELSFMEISSVVSHKSTLGAAHTFSLLTIQGHELIFHCVNSDELKELITYLQDGLKKRSQFVVAIQDYNPPGEGATLLVLQKGDLIVLEGETMGDTVLSSSWSVGQCERTGQKGHFPTESIHILPTLDHPPAAILAELKKDNVLNKQKSGNINLTQTRRKAHTLEKYANQNFRVSHNVTISRAHTLTSARRTNMDELWKHSREPLKLPLLQKLVEHEDLAVEACFAFTCILKYMGDLPTRRSRVGNEYTDKIFTGPLKNDMLRDEVYCQIMKQLTDNRNTHSEERGWELLWLATGLFTCSQNLMKEFTLFLRTRTHPVAKDAAQRHERTLKVGQRKYSPHQVEVEAIQHKHKYIYHKIYFPNDADEAFEVDSSTRARDLCQNIMERLQLTSNDGFTLFIKLLDKIFSVPEAEYFFDYVQELTEWMKKTRPTRSAEGGQFQYQIFFMRKLWVNIFPGKDKNADYIFHYPQELPKYLRGYHKVSKSDAIKLAALIYRTKFGNSKLELQSIPSMLEELIPANVIKVQNAKDWTKTITSVYNQGLAMSDDEAKDIFLQHICQWATFGSAFFEVKQTTESSYPEVIIVAINKNGISIIHPNTKEILAVHPFTHISNWSSGNTYFNIQIGNMVRGTKLLCETSLGYKMDDLLTSYIQLLQSLHSKQKKHRL